MGADRRRSHSLYPRLSCVIRWIILRRGWGPEHIGAIPAHAVRYGAEVSQSLTGMDTAARTPVPLASARSGDRESSYGDGHAQAATNLAQMPSRPETVNPRKGMGTPRTRCCRNRGELCGCRRKMNPRKGIEASACKSRTPATSVRWAKTANPRKGLGTAARRR